MSAETCGGYVPIKWTFLGDGRNYKFFIRDDKEICGYERWSLFQSAPEYRRLLVVRGTFGQAHDAMRKEINKILDNDE